MELPGQAKPDVASAGVSVQRAASERAGGARAQSVAGRVGCGRATLHAPHAPRTPPAHADALHTTRCTLAPAPAQQRLPPPRARRAKPEHTFGGGRRGRKPATGGGIRFSRRRISVRERTARAGSPSPDLGTIRSRSPKEGRLKKTRRGRAPAVVIPTWVATPSQTPRGQKPNPNSVRVSGPNSEARRWCVARRRAERTRPRCRGRSRGWCGRWRSGPCARR